MKNEAHFFIDTSGTLSNKIQFFVQHKNYYGLLCIPSVFYNLFMMNKKNKTRLLAWGAGLSCVLLSFYSQPKPIVENLNKGVKQND